MAVVATIVNSYSESRISILNNFKFTIDITGDPVAEITNAGIIYTLDDDMTYISDDYNGDVDGQVIRFTIGDIGIAEEIQINITVKNNATTGAKTNVYNFESIEFDSGNVDYNYNVYSFKKVGLFPQDIKYVGQMFPAAFVEPSNELTTIWQGGLAYTQQAINVYIFNNYNALNVASDEVDFIFDLQNDALYSILSDLTFDSNVDCVEETAVEKGENALDFDYYNINYSDNMSVIRISFLVTFRESRS